MFYIASSFTNYTYENNVGTTMKQILNQLSNALEHLMFFIANVRNRIQLMPSIESR